MSNACIVVLIAYIKQIFKLKFPKMKMIIFAIVMIASLNTSAQITSVNLQASGLTCSMCSNAISKSLQDIDYVEKVTANIKTSSFTITFKQASKVNLDDIKNKVEDAGFSVAKLQADVVFSNALVQKDKHVMAAGTTFHFLNAAGTTLNGTKTITVVDRGFVNSKTFKQNARLTNMECYQTGKAGSTRVVHAMVS